MLCIRIEQPRRCFAVRARLEVPEGRVYCLLGPSGAGKSTILSVTAGFEPLHQGRIALNGTLLAESAGSTRFHLPAWRRRLGYLAQSTHLFPHLDVGRNIAFALPGNRLDDYTVGLVRELDLRDYLSARIATLSGGQKQRVALARALAARPRVLLLDEPFSALDLPARQEMQELLLRLQAEYGLTVLLVTHQFTEAQRLAHTIGVLDEGVLLQEAAPAGLLTSPASVKVAGLAGYKAFLPAAVFGLGEGLVALHPDRVLPGSFPGLGPVGRARVENCFPYEGRWRVALRLDQGQALEACVSENTAVRVGEEVSFTLLTPPILAG
ncbi:MAG: ABC transporter ATP-binding protein [Peptococcaceae bacterium]|jgi:ABC-type Fe3+/spermidine/putrescine transport system ATPase subunit|nr:ABC transporter ATP-binding protein [Peptococcaceae bacterium]